VPGREHGKRWYAFASARTHLLAFFGATVLKNVLATLPGCGPGNFVRCRAPRADLFEHRARHRLGSVIESWLL
jgi:hypothetical protein